MIDWLPNKIEIENWSLQGKALEQKNRLIQLLAQ